MPPKSNAQTYYQLGNDAVSQGRYDDALILYHQALEIEPQNTEFLCTIGNILMTNLYDYQAAIRYYERALRIKSKDPNILCSLGDCIILSGGDRAQAFRCYEDALHFHPDFFQAHACCAWAYGHCGEYEKALTACDTFLARAQSLPHVNFGLYACAYKAKGIAYDGLGQYEDACLCFMQAHEYNPQDEEIQKNLVVTKFACGEYSGAIACCDEILSRYPEAVDAAEAVEVAGVLSDKALICYISERFELAKGCWYSIDRLSSGVTSSRSLALVNLSYFFILQKNFERVNEIFSRLDPFFAQNDPLVMQGRALSAELQQKTDEAQAYFAQVDRIIQSLVQRKHKPPELIRLYLSRGLVYGIFGYHEKAIQILSQALENYPNYVPLQQTLEKAVLACDAASSSNLLMPK